MTPEQFTALLVALTGLITALGAIFVQLRQTHALVNSRMTQLIAKTELAATKGGELAGRDEERTRAAAATDPGRSAKPTGR